MHSWTLIGDANVRFEASWQINVLAVSQVICYTTAGIRTNISDICSATLVRYHIYPVMESETFLMHAYSY
jgi:hypothetical protein